MSTAVSRRLWNAIDAYVRACGGYPHRDADRDPVRDAAIAVSRAVNAEILDHVKIRLEEALEEAEKAYR